MQVVVLAAGRGERLWPLTRNTPKCLLELVDGMSVLDMQMQALCTIPEIEEIIFVLGYLAEQVEAKLAHYANGYPKIRIVYNPFYADSNNLISLWFAMPFVGESFIVVNGDDVYDSKVLQGLIDASQDQDVVVTIDRIENYDADDMKVITKGDRVVKIGKELDPELTNGESIGMIRFTERGGQRFKETVDKLVRLPVGRHVFWLKGIQELIDQGFPINWSECAPEDWAEIDFHPDLQLVRGSLLENYGDLLARWRNKSLVH